MTRFSLRDSGRLFLVALMLALSWPAVSHAQDAPEPELRLGIVGTSAGYYRGWPLVLSIGVVHPDGVRARLAGESVPPISISVLSGRWSSLVKLVVRNAQGDLQPWPFQLQTSVGSTLTLDATQAGVLSVVLSPEASASLSPGPYTVRAWLDSRGDASTYTSFKGWATSGAQLELKEEPASLTAEQQCAKGYAFARYHQARGNTAQAVAALDAALVQAPGEMLCLTARGDLADLLGQTKQAIDFYSRAIDAKFALSSPNDDEEDSGVLFAACQDLMNKLSPADREPLSTCGYKGTCSAQTDAELCTQGGAECGQVSVTDRCGVARTVSCGTCASPETCGGGGTANVCGCARETEGAFCSRMGKSCGSVTGQDNCGQTRTVASCGTCTSPQSCGAGGVPNVCGCAYEPDSAICTRLGKNCGTLTTTDTCGRTRVVSCGGCFWPQTCGGQGTPNVCGCVSESDAEFCNYVNKHCGTVTAKDHCGRERTVASCGTCTAPDSCGGGGTANQCGQCRPGESCDGWSPVAPRVLSSYYPVLGTSLSPDDARRPYFAWSDQYNQSEGGRIHVSRVEGGQWLQVGGQDLSAKQAGMSHADARNPSLEVLGSTVAVAFSDINPDEARRIYVARADGSSWRLYGSPISSPSGASVAENPSLVLTPGTQPQPVIAWRESYSDNNPWRVYASQWMGSYWRQLGDIINNSDNGSASPPSLAITGTGELFVAWASDDSRIYVKRWDGFHWTSLGVGSISTGDNAMHVKPPSLIMDASGRPVVAWAYCIASSSSDCTSRVMARRWNGSAWETLGSPLGGTLSQWSSTGRPSLALDGSGRLGMAFDEGYGMDRYPFVYRWSGASWELFQSLSPLARSETREVQLMFDSRSLSVLSFLVQGGTSTEAYVYQR